MKDKVNLNANNAEAVVIFQYGTTTAYGSSVDAEPGLVDGSSDTSVSVSLSDMVPYRGYCNEAGKARIPVCGIVQRIPPAATKRVPCASFTDNAFALNSPSRSGFPVRCLAE